MGNRHGFLFKKRTNICIRSKFLFWNGFFTKLLVIQKVVCSQYIVMGNSVYVAPKCLMDYYVVLLYPTPQEKSDIKSP